MWSQAHFPKGSKYSLPSRHRLAPSVCSASSCPNSGGAVLLLKAVNDHCHLGAIFQSVRQTPALLPIRPAKGGSTSSFQHRKESGQRPAHTRLNDAKEVTQDNICGVKLHPDQGQQHTISIIQSLRMSGTGGTDPVWAGQTLGLVGFKEGPQLNKQFVELRDGQARHATKHAEVPSQIMESDMLKYHGLFFIAASALALITFAPLSRLCPDVNVRAERAKPYGLKPSPEGALPSQHGGSAPCYTLQNPTVRIEPAQSLVDVGKTFTVTVMIDNADDLGAFEFDLLFAPAVVTVNNVILGDFLGSTGRTVIPPNPDIDNPTGRASFGAATFGSAPGPDGTGALATIAFTAQGLGESLLDLENVIVLDTQAQHQTVTVEDGTVRVGSTVHSVYLPLVVKGW